MAETETVARTRPARVRKLAEPAKKATAPVVAGEATEVAGTEQDPSDSLTRTYIVLARHKDGDVKSYARFVPPQGSGCVGTFYAPIGTTDVKVLLISPAE